MQKIKAKIHLGNIRRNAEKFSSLTGTKLCAVVKANAYGHGAEEVTNALSGQADSFAVALLEEGLCIKSVACGKEILVFTPPSTEEEVFCACCNGFTLSVGNLKTAELICCTCEKYGLPLQVHLKINTGMNRYGMPIDEVEKLCRYLSQKSWVMPTGIYSHLYVCEKATSKKQLALFLKAVESCKRYFPNAKAHLSATYGALLGKDFALDGVRIGLGLYGYLPVENATQENGVKEIPLLEKGMEIYAPTVAEREYVFGGVGYGKPTSKLAKGERLSVCRYGYADGFLRNPRNGVDGEELQTGNLCMDVCIRKGGKLGEEIPVMTDADKTAKGIGTVSYEVLCACTKRAEFVYDNE